MTPTFVWRSYRTTAEATAVPAQLWECGHLMKVKGAATTFEFLLLSFPQLATRTGTMAVRISYWQVMEEGIKGNQRRSLLEAALLTYSNTACNICSIWHGMFPHLQTSTSNPNTFIASFPQWNLSQTAVTTCILTILNQDLLDLFLKALRKGICSHTWKVWTLIPQLQGINVHTVKGLHPVLPPSSTAQSKDKVTSPQLNWKAAYAVAGVDRSMQRFLHVLLPMKISAGNEEAHLTNKGEDS